MTTTPTPTPTPSADDWESLLWSLMAMDNAERNRAEAVFAELKTQSDVTLVGLVRVLHSPRRDDVRGLAAVLLRRVLLRDAVSLWPEASDEVRAMVKTELLAILFQEENRGIRRKVCDTVGELASSILDDGQWDELLPTLLEWLRSDRVTVRETTLRVWEMIAIYLAQMIEHGGHDDNAATANGIVDGGDLQAHFETMIWETLATSLQDTAGRVALNAIRALSMLLINMDSLHVQRPELLTETLPLVLRALHHLLNTQQHDAVMETLEVLIEVTEPHAAYFQPLLAEFVETMVQIADATSDKAPEAQLPDGCRQLAMEFLVSLAENAPGACRKLRKNLFVQSVYPVAFRMMLELEDLDTWSPETCEEEEENNEISNFDVGSEALERLVGAIGAKKSLPKCFALIHEYATRADDWVHRHAALVGLCQILEILGPEEIDEIAQHLLAQARDPHPRVCCTAIDVLGQIAMDQGPHFQEQYHAPALTVLSHYLQDRARPRLQAHAATALRQFIDMCAPQILAPYLESLLHQLFAVLQEPTTAHVVREQTITALSSVATIAGAAFATYYGAVMPTLREILVQSLKQCTAGATANGSSNASASSSSSAFTLAGITLECISLIGVAVGRETFGPDAPAVMELLAEMQNTPVICENEGIRTYLLQAWARLCQCLGKDFAPYLPVVMPSLLQAAMQQAEFEVDPTMLPDDDDSGSEGRSSMDADIQIAQVNDRCLSIRTSILEEKATACQLLAGMVRDLEEAFFPYAEQVTQVLAPLMTDSVHADIRTASISAMAALVQCVARATLAAPTHAAESPIKQMVDFALGRLVHALASEPELELVMTIMQSMKHCIEFAQRAHPDVRLNEPQLREVVQALLVVLADSFQRRAVKRAERSVAAMGAEEEAAAYEDLATNDAEEEDDDEAASQDNLEQELQFLMADCIGFLAKTHGELFFPVFQAMLWEKILELSAAHCLPEDRKLALYILDDVLEHCGAPAMAEMDTFLPLLVDVLQTSEGYPPLIQAAAFGMGVCARLGGPRFRPHAASTLQLLLEVVRLAHAQEPYMRNATDNAVSAIGLIAEHHPQDVDAAGLFPTWLAMLPLRGDYEESVAVLHRVCRYVRERNEYVLGAGARHAPAVVRVFAETLAHGRAFAKHAGDEPWTALRDDMAQALGLLRASLPAEAMAQAWATLSPPQQAALHALFQ